jgi:hypothetical protein
MMDYGSIPAPPKEFAIKEVVHLMGEERIVRDIISKLTVGSYTGWCVHDKPSIIKKVKTIVNARHVEKSRVECVIRKITHHEIFW